jgi:hypothetical protein
MKSSAGEDGKAFGACLGGQVGRGNSPPCLILRPCPERREFDQSGAAVKKRTGDSKSNPLLHSHMPVAGRPHSVELPPQEIDVVVGQRAASVEPLIDDDRLLVGLGKK